MTSTSGMMCNSRPGRCVGALSLLPKENESEICEARVSAVHLRFLMPLQVIGTTKMSVTGPALV